VHASNTKTPRLTTTVKNHNAAVKVGLSIVRAETSGGKEDIHIHITSTAALSKSPPRETEGRASETYKWKMRHRNTY
jgi:hypothetical protein